MSEGTLSGSRTFVIIWNGEAPMLCAASIIEGLISRRLLSTSLATNGNAAITSGTIEATVPTAVPTISLVRGKTIIMRIRNGIERSRLIIRSIILRMTLGTLMIFPFSPATIRIPSGRPRTIAKKVERTVT